MSTLSPDDKHCRQLALQFRRGYARAKVRLDIMFWILALATVSLIGAAICIREITTRMTFSAFAVVFAAFAMRIASVLGECELQYLSVEHAYAAGDAEKAKHAISQIVCFSALKTIIRDAADLLAKIVPKKADRSKKTEDDESSGSD